MEMLQVFVVLAGWFVGGSVAGFGTGLLTQLLEHQRKRDDLRMREAIENAKTSEHLRDAIEAAGQIILNHVDYIDPDDYFSEAVRHAAGQHADFELRRRTENE